MAELNSPEAIISCRTSVPVKGVPYEDSNFGQHGFAQCIPLDNKQVGLVTSIYSIGGLLGSLYVGKIADKWGRKFTSLTHNFLFFFGSVLNGTSNLYGQLLAGRFISGLGAGSAIVITSLLINELTPTEFKGFMGSMNQVSINVGILLIQCLALIWCNDNQWRWLLITAAIIAAVNFILILFYVDESPVWLAHNGSPNKAFTVLYSLRGGNYDDSMSEVNSWKGDNSGTLLESQTKPATVDLTTYLSSSEYKNSRIATTGILVLQQFDGINSIIFYGVSVLVSIFPESAIIINVLISLVNVVITYFAATLVDTLGRKPLLLTSVTFLGFATFLMGLGIIYTNSILCIVGTFTYITFFAIGMGPIPFLLVGEVTQPQAKALAQSWGTTMNWLATFVVGFLFPVLKSSRLGGGTYFIFTFMCGVSYVFINRYIPETKGKGSYEEVWHS